MKEHIEAFYIACLDLSLKMGEVDLVGLKLLDTPIRDSYSHLSKAISGALLYIERAVAVEVGQERVGQIFEEWGGPEKTRIFNEKLSAAWKENPS